MPNLLKHEDSPYLQQHKDNPVHWYPWCDEAFELAKKHNKAIFISIGYSSCHWCHVMEHEVFENIEIATKLNEDFICIKIDKEERPDIDKFYQEVYMILNQGSGGWPTSIFSTPENKPFYAGTYIPTKSQEDMMGFGDLIDIISLKIAQNDKVLFDNAQDIQAYLQPSSRPTQAATLSDNIIRTFMNQCNHNFDISFGGFGQAPKFPQISTLKGLLDIYLLNKEDKALHMLTHTLDSMVQGGMYDLVQNGFCRYSTESTWLVPHFAKMSYDNALFIELFTLSYKATKNEKYLNIAKDTANFMIKFMSKNNLFYSASDADSDGVEGKYFVYDYEETLLFFQEHGFNEDDALEILSHLRITASGNFEGSSIVRFEQESRPEHYEKAIRLLDKIRQERDYPFIDKKIITSWNAMMIKSLFLLSNYDESFKKIAIEHMDAILEKLYKDKHLYHTSMIGLQAKTRAFLEDYAYMATSLIQAYQCSLDKTYLSLAQEMVDKALADFFQEGKWFFSRGEFITDADIFDSSYAGCVGVIVDALLSLGILVDQKYRDLAFMSLEYHSADLVKRPLRYPYLFNQAIRYIKEDRVIKGSEDFLQKVNSSFENLDYPFVQRYLSSENQAILCGTQSCYTNLDIKSNLEEELQKTL
ncbi:MAG: thioredoxin domain-containing protein [Arcobacter sp.]|nr:MAG: thioredoxin domain-containing protein [Arcobacter sp.]